MTEQPATQTLAADLVAALGELTEVARTSTADAGTYRYKYAELGDVLTIARPVLAGHGLALMTELTCDERTVTINARFLHRTGDTLEAGFLTMARGATAQATGSAITYARRYLVLAALALATDDDDGAEHTATHPTPAEPDPVSPERQRAIDIMDRLKALDAGRDPEHFNVWRADHPGRLTVPAMTRDSEWALTVAAALMDIEESNP